MQHQQHQQQHQTVKLRSPTSVNLDHMSEINLTNLKHALGESEWRNFCDSDGRIVNLSDLKQRIFDGGCEPVKRKELWPILLDIFPDSNMTHQQREDFLKCKQVEYAAIKHNLWYRDNHDLMSKSSHCISDSSFDSNNNNSHIHIGKIPTSAFSTEMTSLYSLAHKIHKGKNLDIQR